jgi:osmotically-inducible protein OsmY
MGDERVSDHVMAGRDERLEIEVVGLLGRDASLDVTRIAVAVDAGIVTLAGFVTDLNQKAAVERAAQSVRGVRAVASQLTVRRALGERDDVSVASAALRSLALEPGLPRDRITVHIEHGWVTLDGIVDTEEQRQLARRALRHTGGVRGLSNHIVVRR